MSGEFRILCGEDEIGCSRLEDRDEGMGTISGSFRPTRGYEKVRRIFRLFTDSQMDAGIVNEQMLAQYYRERDALDLTVRTDGGTPIPVATVHISDFSDGPDDDDYFVEVHLADASWFDADA